MSQGTTNLSGSFTGSLFGTAATASYADNFTVGGTLTAQTINVQIITSSIEFNTGSTRNGALSTNTHQFTGSVLMSGSLGIGVGSVTADYDRSLLVFGANPSYIVQTNDNTGYGYFHIKTPSYDWSLGYDGANNFKISNGTNPASSTKFTIASTGAATFSSTLQCNGAFIQANQTEIFPSAGASNRAYAFNVCNIAAGDFTISQGSTATGGTYTTRLTISPAGNVGIGTSSPTDSIIGSGTFLDIASTGGGALKLHYTNATAYGEFSFYKGSNGSYIDSAGAATLSNNDLIFRTGGTVSNYGVSERMRITSAGIVTISSSVANQFLLSVTNTDAAGEGIISYLNSSSSGKTFFAGYSTSDSAYKFLARSNGGLSNYQSNNTNLSDIRTKKEITPLESYWNKFKNIEIVKFKYKDQTHDDFNIGVIAQQVESIAPEFVDIDGFGQTPEDGIPLKSIYTTDLYHTTVKVLQEAMTKIETLEADNNTLKEILQRNNIQ